MGWVVVMVVKELPEIEGEGVQLETRYWGPGLVV